MLVVKLEEIADLNPPLGRAVDSAERVSFLPMAAIDAEAGTVAVAETRPFATVSKGHTPFLNGDLLVAKITPCFQNGKIALTDLPTAVGFGSTEFHVIRLSTTKVLPKYLLHYLRQDHIRLAGEGRMTGSGGQRRVPADFLLSLPIPLLTLSEQARVVELLEQTSTIRSQYQAALVKLDALLRSLFDDVLEHAGESVPWMPIDVCVKTIIDYRGKSPKKTDEGIPLITARVVKGGALLEPTEYIAEEDYSSWMRRGVPKSGDVLFTTEAPLGEVAQLDGRRVALAQRLLVLRGEPFLLDNTFLMHALTASSRSRTDHRPFIRLDRSGHPAE